MEVINVKGLDERFSYSLRVGPGIEKVNREKIKESKRNEIWNNFKFIHKLHEFSKS
ncbi:hypothetical protein ES705_28275 [subsurface metagenome]